MRPRREETGLNQYAYFVSTQTEGRKPFFRHDRWARLMIATLEHYAETEYTLQAYVIMPDHLHFLITPTRAVERSVQMIKGGFSFRAKRELAWNGGIWQEGFTDHRIRDEEDWSRHLEYIRRSPVRAGLASEAVQYPYMNFPRQEFPQGLKPNAGKGRGVRAEARTLQQTEARTLQQTGAAAIPETGSHSLQSEAKTGIGNAAVKRMGFSPSVDDDVGSGTLVPEGTER